MQEEIIEIINDLCGKTVDVNEELISSGIISSMLIMELICEIEEKYKVQFPPECISEVSNFASVNKITELICEMKNDNKR